MTRKILQTRERIATGDSPNLPAAAENGSVVILPGRNGTLTVAYDDEELRRVNLAIGGQPSASTISRDGRRAYVPDTARNLLVTVDLEQGSVLAETPVGDGRLIPLSPRMTVWSASLIHDRTTSHWSTLTRFNCLLRFRAVKRLTRRP